MLVGLGLVASWMFLRILLRIMGCVAALQTLLDMDIMVMLQRQRQTTTVLR